MAGFLPTVGDGVQTRSTVLPSDVHAIALEERNRARAMVAGLGLCPIVLSRATTELGAFTVERGSGAIQIRISRRIDDEAQVRETMRHELAHQAAWERYRDLGHGAFWQTMATYLGCEPVPCSTYDIPKTVRYEVSCLACGWTTKRQKRSKLIEKPWRYACGHCGGKLAVSDLAAAGR
jgi:hypothetical protein